MANRYLAAVLCIGLAACGGEESGGSGETARAVNVKTFNSSDPTVPTSQYLNLFGDRIDVFGSYDDSQTFKRDQAVVTAGDGLDSIRVFFDDNGLPSRINNQSTGDFTIAQPLSKGMRFETYDAAGRFKGGLAVINDAQEGWQYAPVLGSPSFQGQLVGQLTGQVSASFSVTPRETAGLGEFQKIPPELQAYFDENVSAKSIASGIESIAEIGANAYLIFGAIAGGIIVTSGGTAAAAAVPAAQAAAIGFGASLVANAVQTTLQDLRDGLEDDESRDMFDSLIGKFSRDGMAPAAFIENAVDEVGSILETGRNRVETALGGADSETEVGDELVDDYELPSDFDLEPEPTEMAEAVDTPVEGFGVDADSETYEFTGQVAADGTVDLEGETDDGTHYLNVTGQLEEDGTVSNGQYEGSKGSGTVEADASELGDCSVSQGSGGQGTFSFSHDIGSGGFVDFYYDSYSIPDAFDVFSDGDKIFSTNGLVSGSSNQELFAGGRFVSVVVSAPRSGTAWEYTLGCAKDS